MSLSDLDLDFDQIFEELEQEEFAQLADTIVRDVLPTIALDNEQPMVQQQVLHEKVNQKEEPQLTIRSTIPDDELWAAVEEILKINNDDTVVLSNRDGRSKKIIRDIKKTNSKRFLTVITLLALVIGLYTSCRQFIVGIIEQMVKIDGYESVIATFTSTASGASTSMSWMALYTISRTIVQRYLSLSGDNTVNRSSWKAKCCEFAEYFILFIFVVLFYIPYIYAILELTVYDQTAFGVAFSIWVLIILFHFLHACGVFSSKPALTRNFTSDDAELFVTVNAGFYASFCSLYIIFDAIYREFKYLDFPKKSSIAYSEHFAFINLQIQSGSSILMAVLCAVWLLSKSVSGDRLSLKNKKRKFIALFAFVLNVLYFVLILIGRLS